MAGFEALQGNNDISFGDTETNNLYIGYLKSSFDLSDDTTALAGAFILHGKNNESGNTDIYAADFLHWRGTALSCGNLSYSTEIKRQVHRPTQCTTYGKAYRSKTSRTYTTDEKRTHHHHTTRPLP